MENRNYLYDNYEIMEHWVNGTVLWVEYPDDSEGYLIDSTDSLVEILHNNEDEVFFKD